MENVSHFSSENIYLFFFMDLTQYHFYWYFFNICFFFLIKIISCYVVPPFLNSFTCLNNVLLIFFKTAFIKK